MARRISRLDLRSATPADEEALYVLKRDTLRPYVERTWGWNEQQQRERHRLGAPREGVRLLERDGELLGAYRVLREKDRLVVPWILVRPEHQGRGVGTRIVELIQKQADAGRFPVELHVLKVNSRARGLYERLGFTVTGETETHRLMRWEGRRTERWLRSSRRRASRVPKERELPLGPHDWVLIGGSVIATERLATLGITTVLSLSAALLIALGLLALWKRARHGELLLRHGWMTRTTAISMGVGFLWATLALASSDESRGPVTAPLALGLAVMFFFYAPRTMEIRRRGMLLPFRRGWVPVTEVRSFSWEGERDDELVIELLPDPRTALPRVYRHVIRPAHRPPTDAVLEVVLSSSGE